MNTNKSGFGWIDSCLGFLLGDTESSWSCFAFQAECCSTVLTFVRHNWRGFPYCSSSSFHALIKILWHTSNFDLICQIPSITADKMQRVFTASLRSSTANSFLKPKARTAAIRFYTASQARRQEVRWLQKARDTQHRKLLTELWIEPVFRVAEAMGCQIRGSSGS